MTDRTIDILDLAPDVRELVGACELTGKRILFTRNGRPVVALVSYDEYVALRETIDIAGSVALRTAIEAGEEELKRNALLLPEDLFGE